MKKQLFDLTIEEFTRVLLDYPEKIELQFNGYDENGKTEEPDTLIGTYEELNNFAKSYNPNHVCRILIQSTLSHHFDYEIQLNRLDIYNYLEHITSNFHDERIQIVLSEMDYFYTMVYLEDIEKEVWEKYQKNGWEIPIITYTSKITGQEEAYPDFIAMIGKIFPYRETMYHIAISMLKRKMQKQEDNVSYSSNNLSDKKGSIINYLRIIDAMYEYGFFVTTTGERALKKDVIKAFGDIVNKKFSNPSDNLCKGGKSQNEDGNSQKGVIFDRLKEISISKNKK